jgi:hypothetical protein
VSQVRILPGARHGPFFTKAHSNPSFIHRLWPGPADRRQPFATGLAPCRCPAFPTPWRGPVVFRSFQPPRAPDESGALPAFLKCATSLLSGWPNSGPRNISEADNAVRHSSAVPFRGTSGTGVNRTTHRSSRRGRVPLRVSAEHSSTWSWLPRKTDARAAGDKIGPPPRRAGAVPARSISQTRTRAIRFRELRCCCFCAQYCSRRCAP